MGGQPTGLVPPWETRRSWPTPHPDVAADRGALRGWPSPSSSAGTRSRAARRPRPSRPRGPCADAGRPRPGRGERPPPPPAARRPGRPPIPVRALPLPRLALYESGTGCGVPTVERATGPVDVIYVTGMAMPPPSAPLVVTVHDLAFLRRTRRAGTRHGLALLHAGPSSWRAATPDLVCVPVAGHPRRLRGHGFDPARLRLVPWGVDAELAATTAERGRGRGPATAWTGPTSCGPAPSSPARTCPTLLDAFRAPRPSRRRPGARRPAGLERGPRRATSARAIGRVRVLGFVPADELAGAVRRRLGVLPAQPAGRLRPAGARGHGPGHAGGHLGSGTATAEVGRRRRACWSTPATRPALAEAAGLGARRPGAGRPVVERVLAPAGRRRCPWSTRRPHLLAGGVRRGGPRDRRARVGVNLLWLVPGVVGGSEEYTVRLLEALRPPAPRTTSTSTLLVNRTFPDAHPDAGRARSPPWWRR